MDDRPATSVPLSRRRMIRVGAGGLGAGWLGVGGPVRTTVAAGGAAADPHTALGLVIYCRKHRRDMLRARDPAVDLYEPHRFLDECVRLGAGGMQADLTPLDDAGAARLRDRADGAGRYVEGIVEVPADDADLARFERDVRVTRRAGAEVARTTVIPGRRYERFTSAEEFREYERRAEASLRRSVPVLERHGLKLAVENHKDQRNEERLRLFERIGSGSVGACVDTGNSLALLEDPLSTVRAFAPWAFGVHLKDQAVRRAPRGFLLADVPLGEGCLDLPAMVAALRGARPGVRLSLELITRDPLLVPCLTPAYHAVFDRLPAADLARTIALVESRAADGLPAVGDLPLPARVEREDDNLRLSLRHARDVLELPPDPRSLP